MKRLSAISVVLAVLGIVNLALAEDLADPTGTWKWRFANQSAEHTLKLKLEEGKLTGSIKKYASDRESLIEEEAYKDGIVSLSHTYQGRDGTKIVASYTGKVSGDTIKGTIEFKHPDRTISRDWDARRIK